MDNSQLCTAFADHHKIGTAPVPELIPLIQKHLAKHPDASVLVFDDQSCLPVEVDLRARAKSTATPRKKVGPGRPKLGVVAREITLLPQHWDWLGSQPGGASVALRKLVEAARKNNSAQDRVRQAQEATYRFMTAMGGNLANFEEALRALYAKDSKRFKQLLKAWPSDIREHSLQLAASAFS